MQFCLFFFHKTVATCCNDFSNKSRILSRLFDFATLTGLITMDYHFSRFKFFVNQKNVISSGKVMREQLLFSPCGPVSLGPESLETFRKPYVPNKFVFEN